MTISWDVALFLPLLQGGPRLTFNTQGSAKPPPRAESCNAFAVEKSHIARHVSHFSPVTSYLSPFFVARVVGVVVLKSVSRSLIEI